MGLFSELRRKLRTTDEAYLRKLELRGLDENGHEVVSSIPLEPPVGWFKQPSMFEVMRNMVRSEQLRLAAEAAGAETFEEADDFDVSDDPEPFTSRYEIDDDLPSIGELRRRKHDADVELERAQRAQSRKPSSSSPDLDETPGPGDAEPPPEA